MRIDCDCGENVKSDLDADGSDIIQCGECGDRYAVSITRIDPESHIF